MNSCLVIGQTNSVDWADYYYMNNKFSKAIELYEKSIDSLNIDQERNLAFAYMKLDMKSNASSTFRSISDNQLAGVVDYLTFAQLLPLDSKLSKEYREKARRLKVHQDDILEDDSLVYKSRFYNSTSTLQRKVVFKQDKTGIKEIIILKILYPNKTLIDLKHKSSVIIAISKNNPITVKNLKELNLNQLYIILQMV